MKTIKFQIRKFVVILFIAACNNLNAQISYLGLTNQTPMNQTQLSCYGIEMQNTNCIYSYGIGYSVGSDQKTNLSKLILNADVNLLPFHHAYLAHRLVPFIGIQSEFIQLNTTSEGFPVETNQQKLNFKTGLKISYDRFIGSADYQFGANTVNFKILYAFFIRNRCAKKRIDEINKFDFSQF